MLTRTRNNQKSPKLLVEMQNGIAISKQNKTIWELLIKLNIHCYNVATPLLSIYLRNIKTHVQQLPHCNLLKISPRHNGLEIKKRKKKIEKGKTKHVHTKTCAQIFITPLENNFIHYFQKWETTQMPMNWWMGNKCGTSI